MSSKITISRLKVSRRLYGLTIPAHPQGNCHFADLCRLTASAGINIVFAGTGFCAESAATLCCIDHAAQDAMADLLCRHPALRAAVGDLPPVGLVDLFPHQHRFNVFGLALEALGVRRIKIFGLASSISALSFVIHFHQLQDAMTALAQSFQLPPGYVPAAESD
jgi:hypothetical protein